MIYDESFEKTQNVVKLCFKKQNSSKNTDKVKERNSKEFEYFKVNQKEINMVFYFIEKNNKLT